MSEHQMVSMTYHNNRTKELLATNNKLLERARDAERNLKELTAALRDCEPAATELARTIIDVLLPDADEPSKLHELNILSDRLQQFAAEFL